MAPQKPRGNRPYSINAYICLLNDGENTANYVAVNAKIPKSKVYEVLEGLQKKSMAIKIESRPATYRLTPPKDILRVSLEKKKDDLRRSQIILSNLIKVSERKPLKPAHEFRVLSGRKYILNVIANDLDTLQKSYDAVIGLSTPYPRIKSIVKSKLKSGVNVRYISNINTPERLKVALAYQTMGIDIRHYPLDAPIRFSIHDGLRMAFTLSDAKTTGLRCSPTPPNSSRAWATCSGITGRTASR